MRVQILATENLDHFQLLEDIGNRSVGFIIAINQAVFLDEII